MYPTIWLYLLDSLYHSLLKFVVLNQDLYHSIEGFRTVLHGGGILLVARIRCCGGHQFHQVLDAFHPRDRHPHNNRFVSPALALILDPHLRVPQSKVYLLVHKGWNERSVCLKEEI